MKNSNLYFFKILFIIVLLAFFTSCTLRKSTFNKTKQSNIEPDTNNIKRDVLKLVDFKSRSYQNPVSLNNTAQYIYNELLKTTNFVEFQNFPGIYGVDTFKNVVASFNKECKERIIIGAHYDVCFSTPGADDNASGVAGILELARILKNNALNIKFRIDIVAYCNEEPPFFRTDYMGSKIHTKSLSDSSADVKLAIIYDMIGFYSNQKHSQKYPSLVFRLFYPDKANFIYLLGRYRGHKYNRTYTMINNRTTSLKIKKLIIPENIRHGKNSDHGCFWDYGYNSILLSDILPYRSDNYHEVTDLPETLNYKNIGELVKGTYYYLITCSK